MKQHAEIENKGVFCYSFLFTIVYMILKKRYLLFYLFQTHLVILIEATIINACKSLSAIKTLKQIATQIQLQNY